MNDYFPSGVATPGGASYVSPLLDFSPIANLTDAYTKGAKQASEVKQINAFRNGIPKLDPNDPNSLPDYSAMADTLARAGAPATTFLPLSTAGVMAPLEQSVLKDYMGNGNAAATGAPTSAPAGGPSGNYASRTIASESGGNPGSNSGTSTASTLYGITDPTWTDIASKHPELNLPSTKAQATPDQITAAFNAFTKDNGGALQSAGVSPTDRNLRMAHFLGAQGASSFIQGMAQNPNAPAYQLVSPQAVAANQSVFFDKQGNPLSAIDVYRNQTKGYASSVSAYAPQEGQTAIAGAPPTPDSVPVAATAPAPAARSAGPDYSNIPDQTLGGMIPPGQTINGYLGKLRQQMQLGIIPAFKPAADAAKTQYDAITKTLQTWGVPTPEQKNIASGAARQTEVLKGDVAQGIKAFGGIQGQASQYERDLEPMLQVSRSVLDQPGMYTGIGANRVLDWNRVNAALGNTNAGLLQQMLSKVTATSVLAQINNQKNQLQEAGGTAGRIFQQQVELVQKAAPSLENTPAGNRALVTIQMRMGDLSKEIRDQAVAYKSNPNGPGYLDAGFDKQIATYMQQHPVFTKTELAHPEALGAPTMPKSMSLPQTYQWAKALGLNPGDPIRGANGRYVPAPGPKELAEYQRTHPQAPVQ